VNPGESYDPLLMSLVKSTSIRIAEEETGYIFFSFNLEAIETWIVYVCHSEGEWVKQHI
jgi:hypothetical protein